MTTPPRDALGRFTPAEPLRTFAQVAGPHADRVAELLAWSPLPSEPGELVAALDEAAGRA